MKKRNELAIFEDFRIKPESQNKETENKEPLEKLILFCEVDKNKKPKKYWRKEKDETFVEVNEYGLYQSGANQPKTKLYGVDTKFFVRRNKFKVPVEWWVKEKSGEYKKVKSNISKKEKDEWQGFEFEIQSYLRNEAIKELSLEMKKMKKKAYEYKTEELKKLIEEKESKIIKEFGWKALKAAALASLGLGFI